MKYLYEICQSLMSSGMGNDSFVKGLLFPKSYISEENFIIVTNIMKYSLYNKFSRMLYYKPYFITFLLHFLTIYYFQPCQVCRKLLLYIRQ